MFKKTFLVVFLIGLLIFGYFLIGSSQNRAQSFISPLVSSSNPGRVKITPILTPAVSYEKYSFPNLAKRQFNGSLIQIGEEILKEDDYDYQPYFFYFDSEGKKVSGQLNLPNKSGKFPLVIMLRGYVDKEIYFTGLGTRKAAGFFAENGFVTLAPDFLGFSRSDEESDDILLNRFRRPETVLNLLASVKNLNQALERKGLNVRVDPDQLFIWAHSNGGQIALSVLEITGQPIPTTLWAPVSEGFPESILQYADEMDDDGQIVITAVRQFELNHDPTEFSIAEYWNQISAPVQIHQGTDDPYIEAQDSKRLWQTLKKNGLPATYLAYQGDDHNLSEGWDEVVNSDLIFFQDYLK